MQYHFRPRRGGDVAGGRRRRLRRRRERTGGHLAAGRDGDVLTAGGTLDLGAGAGLIHGKFLIAVGAIENDVHNWKGWFRASLSLTRSAHQKIICREKR